VHHVGSFIWSIKGMFFSPISLQRICRFITFPFQPPYIPLYFINETDNG